MRLDLALPTKRWPRRHLTLTCSIEEGVELRPIIENEVLNNAYRVERDFNRERKEIVYYFALKHLEKLRMTFPYTDIGKRLDRKLVREAAEQYNNAPAPHVFVPGLNVRLMGQQKKFVRWYLDLPTPRTAFLTDEMGLGKTVSALAVIQKLEYEHVLVVCPNSAKWTAWAEDTQTKCRGLDYVVVDGNHQEREAQLQKHSRITIINYEALWRHEPTVRQLEYDLLICDEYHRIKSPTAKQTLGVHAVKVRDILLMSGTPILNGRIEELWSGLHRMWPNRFPSYYTFQALHCIRGRGNRIVAYRNLNQLRQQTEPFELRRRKDQVMKDLPAMIKVRREVELTAEGRKLYNAIIDDMTLWLEDGQQKKVLTMLSRITRLKQAAFSPELYGGSKTSPKLTELKEIIEQLVANGEKAIVFSQWKKATRIIQRELAGYNPAYIDGTVPAKDRAEQVRLFQHDENTKVFVGTIGACREAITLTAASYVIFTDKGWTPAENEQAAARAHRYGQKRTVHVIELYAKDTIEDHIEALLKRKQNTFDAIVDRRGHVSRKAVMTVDSIKELLVKV